MLDVGATIAAGANSISGLDILKVAGASGVFVFLLACIKDYFVHRKTLKRDAMYLAARLVVVLEKFAVDCANTISDNDLYSSSGGSAGTQRFSLPTLGAFPSDADWKAIAPNLVDRVMSMPNELSLVDHKILFWWEVLADRDCMQTETNDQSGEFGFYAWELALDLRKECNLPEAGLLARSWDFVALLKKQRKSARSRQQKGQCGC
jgi:hypothetical protein